MVVKATNKLDSWTAKYINCWPLIIRWSPFQTLLHFSPDSFPLFRGSMKEKKLEGEQLNFEQAQF